MNRITVLILCFIFSLFFSPNHVNAQQEVNVVSLAYIPTYKCQASGSRVNSPELSLTSAGVIYSGAVDGSIEEGKLGIYSDNLNGTKIQVEGINRTIGHIRLYYWGEDFPSEYKVSYYNNSNVVYVANVQHSLSKGIVQSHNPPILYQNIFLPDNLQVTHAELEIVDFRENSPDDRGQINIYEVELYTNSETDCLDRETIGTIDWMPKKEPNEIQKVLDKVELIKDESIRLIEDGTNNYINFNVVSHTNLFEKQPISENFFPMFDYQKILTEKLDICDLVDNHGVSQVWIYSYHNDRLAVPDESNMAMGRISRNYWNNGYKHLVIEGATYGDISNGSNRDDMPTCNHTYTLYNPTWSGGSIGNAVHNHMHQFENLFAFLGGDDYCRDGFVNEQCVSNNGSPNLFWDYFTGKKFGVGEGTWVCGNAHFPPNTDQDYHYSNTTIIQTTCTTWNPDKFRATENTNISCNDWGCTDTGYYVWWMKQIPNKNNTATFKNRPLTNWWDAYANFDFYLATYGKDLTHAGITPPISPSPAPPPTPDSTPDPNEWCNWPLEQRVNIDRDPENNVNIFDYNQLVSQFGTSRSADEAFSHADINCSGSVDIFDYNLFVGAFSN